jgi:signal transduction histidine kinase
MEHCLYRVTQEALNNVVKHARATHAAVLLDFRVDEIGLVVEDDGCGFDIGACSRHDRATERVGLIGMQERTALMNGSIEFETRPQLGTRVSLRLPISSTR